MCLNPIMTPHGAAACRNCWQCHTHKVNDYVGRCIAENKTCSKSYFLTFTYAGKDMNHRAFKIHQQDFTRFLKRIRTDYKLRFFQCAELGDQKGRVHFHAILFFYGDYPALPYGSMLKAHPQYQLSDHEKKQGHLIYGKTATRFIWKYWPENRLEQFGHVYVETVTNKTARYIAKYCIPKEGTVAKIGYSKNPPLGYKYFEARAKQYVEQMIAPRDYFYTFPDVYTNKDKTERKQFMLKGTMREKFMDVFLSEWEKQHPNVPIPTSEIVEDRIQRSSAKTEDDIKAIYNNMSQQYHTLHGGKLDKSNLPVIVKTHTTRKGIITKNEYGAVHYRRLDNRGDEIWRIHVRDVETLKRAYLDRVKRPKNPPPVPYRYSPEERRMLQSSQKSHPSRVKP